MKYLKVILPFTVILAMSVGMICQYRENLSLRSQLSLLQTQYSQLEDALAFSQLVASDLESEIRGLYEQPIVEDRAATGTAINETGATTKLSEQEQFELETIRLYYSNPDFPKQQANQVVTSLYSPFLNTNLRNVEKRKAVGEMLRKMEEGYFQQLVSYLLAREDGQANFARLSQSEHDADVYVKLAEFLDGEELIVYEKYRETELPKKLSRAIALDASRLTVGLKDENKQVLIGALTGMQLNQPSDLSFKEQVDYQVDAIKQLRAKIAELEMGQAAIANRYIDSRYRVLELTQTLLMHRADGKSN